MSVVAAGPVTKPMSLMATLIASCAQFQADVVALGGAASASTANALAYVHWPESDDAIVVLPRAIIRFGGGFNSLRVGVGTHQRNGLLEVSFEYPVEDDNASEAEQLALFANKIGTILDQMEALSGQGDSGDGSSHLNVVEITETFPPGKCQAQTDHGESDDDAYFGVSYLIRWEG